MTPRLALVAALALGCATGLPEPPDPPEWNDARRDVARGLSAELARQAISPGELVVRLAFESGVDLDLYVTDPLLETVYYANTPSVSGGRLEQDRRCAEDEGRGVRIETVRFPAPPAGRYRIGVDFPHRCDGGPDEVAYALTIDDRGERAEHTALARWLEFTTIVLEFELGAGPTATPR